VLRNGKKLSLKKKSRRRMKGIGEEKDRFEEGEAVQGERKKRSGKKKIEGGLRSNEASGKVRGGGWRGGRRVLAKKPGGGTGGGAENEKGSKGMNLHIPLQKRKLQFPKKKGKKLGGEQHTVP